MRWQLIPLVASAAILLAPIAFVWYLNIGGVISAYRSRDAHTVESA